MRGHLAESCHREKLNKTYSFLSPEQLVSANVFSAPVMSKALSQVLEGMERYTGSLPALRDV